MNYKSFKNLNYILFHSLDILYYDNFEILSIFIFIFILI